MQAAPNRFAVGLGFGALDIDEKVRFVLAGILSSILFGMIRLIYPLVTAHCSFKNFFDTRCHGKPAINIQPGALENRVTHFLTVCQHLVRGMAGGIFQQS